MSAAVLSARMSPIAEALIARSNGKYDAESLRSLVADLANEYEGARVQDYLEVLVTKEATDVLQKMDALRTTTA